MNRFLTYMVVEALVVLLVILTFRIVEDRQMAASLAGMMFIFIPLIILLKEVLKHRSQEWLFLAGHLQFLVLFALPIMGLRVVYWGQDFSSLSLGPVRAEQLHQFANYSYILMVLTTMLTRRKYHRMMLNKKGSVS